MAYDRYVTEFSDNENRTYGVMDAEAREEVSNLKSAIDFGYTDNPPVGNGSFAKEGTYTTNSKRLRTNFIPVKPGDQIVIDNGSLWHACGAWEGTLSQATNVRNDGSFSSDDETIVSAITGYYIVVFAKSDTSQEILLTDFDGFVRLYANNIYRNENSIKILQGNQNIITSKNLIGNEAKEFYPVYLPVGTVLTWSMSSGTFANYPTTHLELYDETKTRITYFSTAPVVGQSSRTIVTETRTAYYLRFDYLQSAPMQVEIGNIKTEYQPYMLNVLSLKQDINDLVSDQEKIYSKSWSYFANGSWRNSDGRLTTATNRVRMLERLFMPKGMTAIIDNLLGFDYWFSWSTWSYSASATNGYVLITDSDRKFSRREVLEFDSDCWLMIASGRYDNADISAETVHPFSLQYGNADAINYVEKKVDAIRDFGELLRAGQLVSHRCMPFPENTLEGLIACIKTNGIRIHEMDVAFTSDNVPVLLHDTTINRTARNADGTTISSTINIANITYEQALQYDFGIYKGQEYAGIKISKLEDALIALRRYNCGGIIDILGHTYTVAQYKIMHDLFVGTRMVNRIAINGDTAKLTAYTNLFSDTPLNPSSSTNNLTTVQNAVDAFGKQCPLLVLSGYIENATDTSASFFESIHTKGAIAMLGMTSDVETVNDLFNAGCDLVYSEELKNSDVQ